MKPKLVIFDLAGTTVVDEDFVAIALIETLKKENMNLTIEDANEVMGIPKPLAISCLLQKRTGEEFRKSDKYVKQLFQKFQKNMIEFYLHSEKVKEIEGVSETFQFLNNNEIKVGIDTGFSSKITEIIMARMSWKANGLVSCTVSSDQVKQGRPHPDMIYYLMKSEGIESAQQVAKVGDTPSDIMEGKSAGCGCVIGVLSGSGKEHELASLRPDFIIDSVADIEQKNIVSL